MGYQVDAVDNGRQAVDSWRRNNYDLILMDCQMPEFDGFQATQEIRALEPAGRHIPIIALTANAMPGAEALCKAAGMDAYITKPFDRDHLEACLDGYLASGAPHARTILAPSAVEPDADGSARPPEPAAPPVDLDALSAFAAGDAAFQLDLIQTFIGVGEAALADIENAFAHNETAVLVRAVHKLKGNSGCVFATEVNRCAAQLEAAALSGQHKSLRALTLQLRRDFTRAVDFLHTRTP